MSNLHIAENQWNEIKVVPKNSSVGHKCVVSSTAAEKFSKLQKRGISFLKVTGIVTQWILILIKMMINIYGINSSTLNHYILSSNSLFSLVQLNNL